VALTDNVPLMTAWGNDASFDRIFAEQLMPLVRPHDLLLAISASGSSPNVLEALRAAREAGARTMAWTGATGGSAAPLADTVIRVPATTIEQVEDAHMVLAHALTVFMRSRLRERSPEEAGAAGP
jgi:D-sedoheptulose 7-phosphate isomerase